MAYDEDKDYGSKTFFFWNDKPYRKITVSKRKNLVTAWDILDNRKVAFRYTDLEKNKRKAFSTSEVSDLLDRGVHILCRLVQDGKIPSPYTVAPQVSNLPKVSKKYLWSEKDVLAARRCFEESGYLGYDLSEAEVRARMNNDDVIYWIRTKDGKFIPTWKAE